MVRMYVVKTLVGTAPLSRGGVSEVRRHINWALEEMERTIEGGTIEWSTLKINAEVLDHGLEIRIGVDADA